MYILTLYTYYIHTNMLTTITSTITVHFLLTWHSGSTVARFYVFCFFLRCPQRVISAKTWSLLEVILQTSLQVKSWQDQMSAVVLSGGQRFTCTDTFWSHCQRFLNWICAGWLKADVVIKYWTVFTGELSLTLDQGGLLTNTKWLERRLKLTASIWQKRVSEMNFLILLTARHHKATRPNYEVLNFIRLLSHHKMTIACPHKMGGARRLMM